MEKRMLDHDEITRHCSAITWQYDHSEVLELSKLDSIEQYFLKQKIIGCMVLLWAMMNELKAVHDSKHEQHK
jgi:hypothetical protein